jgi:SAM-dependent methyltransferase
VCGPDSYRDAQAEAGKGGSLRNTIYSAALQLHINMPDNTKRFSNRVEDYVKYRPGYPTAIIGYLRQQYGLTTDKLVADVGAGTGISSAMLLNAGYKVVAVEPNKEMREKAIDLLSPDDRFTAVDGTAEATGLAAASVDAIISAQAFHWFDTVQARAEFARILKPGGIVALIWNERKTTTPFEQEYAALITKHASDYVPIDQRIDTEKANAFFAPQPMQMELFQNKQEFDKDGLIGRLASSSYMPARGQQGYDAMITGIDALFNKNNDNGLVSIHYDTRVYAGRLS